MRRLIILFILILLCFFLINYKVKMASLEKIDLKLEQEEIGLVIDDSFLLEINDINKLYILKNKININSIKNIFNIDKLSNKKINKSFKIKLYDYYFCTIFDNSIDTNNCTFIYIKNTNNRINFNNKNKVVFYNNEIDGSYKEELYTKWLDIYELNKHNYTILKIKKDTYNILNIPL